MTICRVQHNAKYVAVNYTIADDNRISFKAKGLWFYAFSRRDDWQFYIDDLINRSTDGRESVRSGLKELEKAGYLKRTPKRVDNRLCGWDWIMYELPQSLEEETEIKEKLLKDGFPVGQEACRSEDRPLTSKDKITSTEKKEESEPEIRRKPPMSDQSVRLSSLLFDLMKQNNPNAKIGNPDKSAAEIDKLNRIDGYSWDKIEAIIRWSQKDHFWKGNILSGSKLRVQAGKLVVQMDASAAPTQTDTSRLTKDINGKPIEAPWTKNLF